MRQVNRALFGLAACLAITLVVLCENVSRAFAAPGEVETLLEQAETAERELRFADAEKAWQSLQRAQPGGRLSRRAAARLSWLGERSEGGYGPLAELQRARRRGNALSVDELAGLEARVGSFPTGRVRREARALIAETHLRLDRPLDALRTHRAWLDEPGLDDAEFLRAANGLARARARLGDLSGALEVLEQRGLAGRAEAAALRVRLVARWARPLAALLLLVFGLLALVSITRRRASRDDLVRALAPSRWLALAWVLGPPLLMAFFHRPETWRTLALLVPGAALVVGVAAVVGASLDPGARRARIAIAVLGVLAQVAVAYLALDRSGALVGWLVATAGG